MRNIIGHLPKSGSLKEPPGLRRDICTAQHGRNYLGFALGVTEAWGDSGRILRIFDAIFCPGVLSWGRSAPGNQCFAGSRPGVIRQLRRPTRLSATYVLRAGVRRNNSIALGTLGNCAQIPYSIFHLRGMRRDINATPRD